MCGYNDFASRRFGYEKRSKKTHKGAMSLAGHGDGVGVKLISRFGFSSGMSLLIKELPNKTAVHVHRNIFTICQNRTIKIKLLHLRKKYVNYRAGYFVISAPKILQNNAVVILVH